MKNLKNALMTLMALVSIVACSKGSDSSNNNNVVNPYYNGCTSCGGYGQGSGSMMYSGTGTDNYKTAIQFQVYGAYSSQGSITGVVSFNGYYCQNTILNGQLPISMASYGQMTYDVFSGQVMLGNLPAGIQVIPSARLVKLVIPCGMYGQSTEIDMNYY